MFVLKNLLQILKMPFFVRPPLPQFTKYDFHTKRILILGETKIKSTTQGMIISIQQQSVVKFFKIWQHLYLSNMTMISFKVQSK